MRVQAGVAAHGAGRGRSRWLATCWRVWVSVRLCAGQCTAVSTSGAWSWRSWQLCRSTSSFGPPQRSVALGYDPYDGCPAYTWFHRFSRTSYTEQPAVPHSSGFGAPPNRAGHVTTCLMAFPLRVPKTCRKHEPRSRTDQHGTSETRCSPSVPLTANPGCVSPADGVVAGLSRRPFDRVSRPT